MMVAKVSGCASSTDMALLLGSGGPANTGRAIVDRGHSQVGNRTSSTEERGLA
jgi:hypothetical protein